MADATPNPPTPVTPSPAVARPLDYRGKGGNGPNTPGSWYWRKFRAAFSRDSLYSAFKTLLWAVPLTLLIWVYAERDGEHETLGYTLVIGLHNGDLQHRVVHLNAPQDGRIRVDLKGPNALLGELEKKLSSSTEQVRIDVDPNLSDGSHAISIADQISNDPLFVENGISVKNPDPPDITVTVDKLVVQTYQIQPPKSLSLASPPAFEPREVRVRMPQSLIDSGKYAVIAQLDAFPDIATPGTHDLTNVPVAVYRLTATGPESTPINDPAVTVTPAFVSAKIEVKNSDEMYVIPILPVWPTMETGMQDKYRVVLGDPAQTGVLHNVKVVGPPAQIDLLSKSSTFQPIAWFEVDPGKQQTNTNYTAAIHVEGLPDGVHVILDDQNRNVTYQLNDRATGG